MTLNRLTCFSLHGRTEVSNDAVVPGVNDRKDSASARTPDFNSSNGNSMWGYLHNMSTRVRVSANLLHFYDKKMVRLGYGV